MALWRITHHAALTVLNLLLIVAGANLLRRRPAGITLHVVLGWATTGWVGIGLLVALVPLLLRLTDSESGWVISDLVHLVAYCPTVLAYPIFLIVWFAPGKHRDEFYASLAPPA